MSLRKFSFKVTSKENYARTGLIKTHRGKIHTPVFMPVGTQATVKATFIDDIIENCQLDKSKLTDLVEKEITNIPKVLGRNINVFLSDELVKVLELSKTTKDEFNEIVRIKVRSTGKLLKAKINFLDNFAKVEILDKETGISPGQACVFYSKDEIGDKLLGGGWIHRTFNNFYPIMDDLGC